ncbi:uncharacterized protein EI90DRAFT_3252650 [Cantharellus anzutake]|uniref:uncharacterized protein n=1 Tax=Cantharellus anzutake TaxID=1750568 RepID=UPI001903C8BC|nr:uncharacterized protein EI90DRAFT_3252650 [Cantharellus anzutake]KAF8338308.1 hypothetical protein EI90DRAFT_3252650 [Cantharellus anzutake]
MEYFHAIRLAHQLSSSLTSHRVPPIYGPHRHMPLHSPSRHPYHYHQYQSPV